MGGRGVPPKPAEKRRRRNVDPVGETLIEAGGDVVQPALPENYEWSHATREWWQAWADEPLTTNFRPTDWLFLLDTALLHEAVWGRGELKYLPELRLRVAKMGATVEDRARLRVNYVRAPADSKPAAAEPRPTSSARRSRLLKVVNGGEA